MFILITKNCSFFSKAFNVIKIVENTKKKKKEEADKNTFLHLYRSQIRSKLDYGCIVYGAARTSYIKALDECQRGKGVVLR
jgi:hypothetical protein